MQPGNGDQQNGFEQLNNSHPCKLYSLFCAQQFFRIILKDYAYVHLCDPPQENIRVCVVRFNTPYQMLLLFDIKHALTANQAPFGLQPLHPRGQRPDCRHSKQWLSLSFSRPMLEHTSLLSEGKTFSAAEAPPLYQSSQHGHCDLNTFDRLHGLVGRQMQRSVASSSQRLATTRSDLLTRGRCKVKFQRVEIEVCVI